MLLPGSDGQIQIVIKSNRLKSIQDLTSVTVIMEATHHVVKENNLKIYADVWINVTT